MIVSFAAIGTTSLAMSKALSSAVGVPSAIRYHSYITKAETLIFLKIGFFRQNNRISYSTLHFDEIFML